MKISQCIKVKMEAYKFIYLVLLSSVSVNSQYQFQQIPNPYNLPQQQVWPQQQQVWPQQQQDLYFNQQQLYYPVNQPIYQPANNQPVYYPYPYQYGGGYQVQPQQTVPKSETQNQTVTPDPYAGVETEYIDVQPETFRRIIEQLQVQPTIISYESRNVKNGAHNPKYSYAITSEQNNNTNAPAPIKKYESSSKIYTFNKTYVLHPGDNKNSVVNLNFVNGVQVTESPDNIEEKITQNGTASLPDKNGKRFIDVPVGCEDGLKYSATGGCFSPFTLTLANNTENSNPAKLTTTRIQATNKN